MLGPSMVPSSSKPDTDEQTGEPLVIIDGQFVLVADIGKMEYHRTAYEHFLEIADNGSTGGDDVLGEMIIKRGAFAVHLERCVAEDGEDYVITLKGDNKDEK